MSREPVIKYSSLVKHNLDVKKPEERKCKAHARALPAWAKASTVNWKRVGRVHPGTAVEECGECGYWRARGLRFA
ncbi:unnamed protein product [marine sediment metagenome]|uniref:Uncharacterized protein n=1 Tax=marine sediment metagenome TaxID=412755 RepID=X0V7T6_9ZZZZ